MKEVVSPSTSNPSFPDIPWSPASRVQQLYLILSCVQMCCGSVSDPSAHVESGNIWVCLCACVCGGVEWMWVTKWEPNLKISGKQPQPIRVQPERTDDQWGGCLWRKAGGLPELCHLHNNAPPWVEPEQTSGGQKSKKWLTADEQRKNKKTILVCLEFSSDLKKNFSKVCFLWCRQKRIIKHKETIRLC